MYNGTVTMSSERALSGRAALASAAGRPAQDPTLLGDPGSISLNPPEPLPRVHDHELIDRVLAGSTTAARELYDAHVGAVFRLALRMTADEQLAQDATQEAFVRAFRGLGEFRRDASLRTWLHHIAVAVTLNALRDRKRWDTRFTEIEMADQQGVARRTGPVELDLRDRLYAAIDALPAIYRSVFVLHEIEGHTHEEIGALLRIAAGTSKARLNEARAKLRAALQAFEGEWRGASA
jgi:RNA polymerase sigma-70 factor (ECF subfamily)